MVWPTSYLIGTIQIGQTRMAETMHSNWSVFKGWSNYIELQNYNPPTWVHVGPLNERSWCLTSQQEYILEQYSIACALKALCLFLFRFSFIFWLKYTDGIMEVSYKGNRASNCASSRGRIFMYKNYTSPVHQLTRGKGYPQSM